jgi:hypothetical protein
LTRSKGLAATIPSEMSQEKKTLMLCRQELTYVPENLPPEDGFTMIYPTAQVVLPRHSASFFSLESNILPGLVFGRQAIAVPSHTFTPPLLCKMYQEVTVKSVEPLLALKVASPAKLAPMAPV